MQHAAQPEAGGAVALPGPYRLVRAGLADRRDERLRAGGEPLGPRRRLLGWLGGAQSRGGLTFGDQRRGHAVSAPDMGNQVAYRPLWTDEHPALRAEGR